MKATISLNPTSGEKDIVNVFNVYRLKSFIVNNYFIRIGLFEDNDGGHDKFIAFGPNGELVMVGDKNYYNVIGSRQINGKYPIANFKTKANAGILNKWLCLSVH